MTNYQPATPHSNSIARPNCSKCGTATLLFGIEPDKPDHELWSFDCPRCARRRWLRAVALPPVQGQSDDEIPTGHSAFQVDCAPGLSELWNGDAAFRHRA